MTHSLNDKQVSFLFSDRGLPDGYRCMNGYGSHTFKLVNAAGEAFYCKFHLKTDQGIRNLDTPKSVPTPSFRSATEFLRIFSF